MSTFGNAIEFFDEIGIYDVILPFLLVFTIVFAILEKTKVFGEDDINGQKFTKKNLNSMTAFVIAFFVVASSKLVEIVTKVSSQVVVLLLLSIFFLLLVGSFFKEGEATFLEGSWRTFFMIIMFLGITGIFLYAIETDDGEPWLEYGWDYIIDNMSSNTVSSIVLIAVIVGFMYYVVQGEDGGFSKKKKPKEENSEDKK